MFPVEPAAFGAPAAPTPPLFNSCCKELMKLLARPVAAPPPTSLVVAPIEHLLF